MGLRCQCHVNSEVAFLMSVSSLSVPFLQTHIPQIWSVSGVLKKNSGEAVGEGPSVWERVLSHDAMLPHLHPTKWTKRLKTYTNRAIYSGGSKGAQGTRPPTPRERIFFNFMQFWGNFNKIVSWRPPPRVGTPSSGNPGSATDLRTLSILVVSSSARNIWSVSNRKNSSLYHHKTRDSYHSLIPFMVAIP